MRSGPIFFPQYKQPTEYSYWSYLYYNLRNCAEFQLYFKQFPYIPAAIKR